MSFEPVDVYVFTDDEQPVSDVLIKVYSQDGSVYFTQAATDLTGRAGFLLETITYSMRFYKMHVGFSQPQEFEVLEAPATNSFNVQAELFNYPTPTNPRFCRCSGFFLDGKGEPMANMAIHFTPAFDCVLVEEDALPADAFKVFTDNQGYACVDLLRGAEYLVFVEALQGETGTIQVPDEATANLPDVLLPRVHRVVFDPIGPYTIAVDVEMDVTPTVYYRSGVFVEGTDTENVTWSVDDDSIAAISVDTNGLVIRGVSAGTTQLLAERTATSATRIPDEPIEGVPVDITVT